ncbi:MAG: GMC family oxidoreductase N-terminal domain-containing protein, partial [Nocardioides sp.]
VVGAGSAGCAVAARLVEAGYDVILLEAGPPDAGRLFAKPGMVSLLHAEPRVRARFDWGYRLLPQSHADRRRIPATRGRVLGGSSSVNGMIWARGNRADYDDWSAAGNVGWDAAAVNEVYRRMENWEGGVTAFRGAGGPIEITRHPAITDASRAFVDAAASALGVPVNDDYNADHQLGAHVIQQNAREGQRYSSAYAYLESAAGSTAAAPGRGRLTVHSGVTVTKVVVVGGRATGVEVVSASDPAEREFIEAGHEVVLAAGAFGSPQMLMLSGIGPADHLSALGLPVVADLPVGENLHDQLYVPMTFLMDNSPYRATPAFFARSLVRETLLPGSTFLANTVFEAGAFVRSSTAGNRPDLQLIALPWAYPSPNQDSAKRQPIDGRPALTVLATLLAPTSRGSVRLSDSDPRSAPLIDPHFLETEHDRAVLVEGMEMIRAAMAQPGIARHVVQELHPGADLQRADLQREIRRRVTTVHHPVGTCRMGIDDRAVVGPDLRVRGVEGLRVADASIMPTITSGNTNAPTTMIGERCAELIRLALAG